MILHGGVKTHNPEEKTGGLVVIAEVGSESGQVLEAEHLGLPTG